MSFNPERAAFVSQEYRYASLRDDTTLALYANAKIIDVDTNLNADDATDLASDIFAASSVSARTFTFTVEGAFLMDSFVDGPPRFYLEFADHDGAVSGRVYHTIAAKVSYQSDTTTVTVRG